MDWDHLRFFAALAQTGTLAGAARVLGVEHTTVARRIQALEQHMGCPLFVREASGHRLNAAGQQLTCGAGHGASRAWHGAAVHAAGQRCG